MRPMVTLAALFLAALGFVASPAVAGPHHGPGMGRLERQLEKLDLSDAQKQKVQAILTAAKPKREEIHGRMKTAFDDMRALLDQDSPSESAVLAQADRIGAIQTEAHKAMLTTLLQVRAELTPEQRAKLSENMREMRKHRMERWHKGHGGKPESPEGAPVPESRE